MTQKDKNEFFYKKDDEIKGNKFENEDIIEYGDDFLVCQIIHDRD